MIYDIEELKRLKKENHYSYREIAEKSGIPIGTVQKVLGGITERPRRKTLEALSKVLDEPSASLVAETEYQYNLKKESDTEKAEALLASKHQGEFTVDDYYVISEVWRIELIDGVIYDMASPLYRHQAIVGGVYAQLLDHAIARDDECMPVVSPLDVQLDEDEKTMVQPDVIIVCDPRKILKNKGKNVFGAPDFAMEVISPSSRTKDKVTKRDKYRDAGVREYWLIDPEAERIQVFDFKGRVDGLYTFDQKVPVRISGGECAVNFPMIKKQIEKMERFGLDR